MTGRFCKYEAVQRRNFRELVHAGAYGVDFDHKPEAKAFVKGCINDLFPVATGSGLRILDCGCGSGAWLDFIRGELDCKGDLLHRYYGFDLTSEMIEVACRRLPEFPPTRLHQGNIIAAESYVFDDEEPLFDLIYCYDVVQQLPLRLQFRACETMAEHLRNGGVAIMFDQDRHSSFGRAMGCAKFVTRYLKIPLVPPHYTAARYPPLRQFARRLRESGYETTIKVAPNGRKRALVVQLPSAT